MSEAKLIPWNVMLKDINKEWIISHCVNTEAGYVNNKDDLGKETNHGITYATAQEWKSELVKQFGWNGKMIDLTREMAWFIYDKGWWQRMRCDEILEISPLLCHRIFDFAINGGRTVSIKYLQRLLNTLNRGGKDYPDFAPDGGIGPNTLGQLKAFAKARGPRGIMYLLNGLSGMHINHYVEISEKRPQNETFTNGWFDRMLTATEFYARTMIVGEGK